MSKQIIEWLGPTPSDEDCAQTVDSDFDIKNLRECKRFRDLLQKIIPTPEKASVGIMCERHDFGMYREVVLFAEDPISEEDEKIVGEWSEKINSLPNTWAELEAMVKA